MANNCGSLLAAGLGKCNSRIQNVSFAILYVTGNKYTSAQLDTLAQTKTYLAASAGIVAIYLPLSGFEITTDEPDVVTSQLGTKSIFDDKVPSAMAYLDRSFHDYKHLWDSNNTVVDIVLGTKDGYFVMTSTVNNEYRGLRAEIYSAPNLPKTDDPTKAHPIYFNFKSVSDFKNLQILPMAFSQFDIEDIVPVGVDLRATGAYTTDSITARCDLRGGSTGKAGLTTWEILDSNVDDTTVTAVDDGAGNYTLTIDKNHSTTGDNLAAGNWVKVQASIVATSHVTYLSNVLTIKV